jgi:hypothetical protein
VQPRTPFAHLLSRLPHAFGLRLCTSYAATSRSGRRRSSVVYAGNVGHRALSVLHVAFDDTGRWRAVAQDSRLVYNRQERRFAKSSLLHYQAPIEGAGGRHDCLSTGSGGFIDSASARKEGSRIAGTSTSARFLLSGECQGFLEIAMHS